MKVLLLLITVSCWADPASDLARAEYVTSWIYANIEYVASPEVIKDPFVTVADGTGDCADDSALLLYTLTREGIEAQLLLLDLLDYVPHHAVVLLHGVMFDPARGAWFAAGEFPLRYEVRVSVQYTNILFGE